MPKQSYILTVPDSLIIRIKETYMFLCQKNKAAALLLDLYEYGYKQKLELLEISADVKQNLFQPKKNHAITNSPKVWMEFSDNYLTKNLLGFVESHHTLISANDFLIALGFIEKKISQKGDVRKISLEVSKLNEAIQLVIDFSKKHKTNLEKIREAGLCILPCKFLTNTENKFMISGEGNFVIIKNSNAFACLNDEGKKYLKIRKPTKDDTFIFDEKHSILKTENEQEQEMPEIIKKSRQLATFDKNAYENTEKNKSATEWQNFAKNGILGKTAERVQEFLLEEFFMPDTDGVKQHCPSLLQESIDVLKSLCKNLINPRYDKDRNTIFNQVSREAVCCHVLPYLIASQKEYLISYNKKISPTTILENIENKQNKKQNKINTQSYYAQNNRE